MFFQSATSASTAVISKCLLLLTVMLFSLITAGEISAAELPGAATAGGARPILDDETGESFVYPNATPIPDAESIEKFEADVPRMQVRGFRIQGVKKREALDITQESIESLVKSQAEKLVASAGPGGFTISMFESLTRAISGYYRLRGFFLARAYIPEQTVNDGVVTIVIVEGFLDQIIYRGNSLYSNAQLDNLFKSLVGESIFLEDIEQAIFIANDYPGLDAKILFGPGLKPGSAAIQVNAREVASQGFVSWDNYGTSFTGEERWRGNYRFNNLFGQADKLETNLILTLNPQNSLYYDVSYAQPVISNDFIASGGLGFNEFDVGGNLADLNISGESTVINANLGWIYSRKRNQRITFSADLSLKDAKNLFGGSVDSNDSLTVLSGRAAYQGTSWADSRDFQQMSVTLSLGLPGFLGSMDSGSDPNSSRRGETQENAGGDFVKISFDYRRVHKLPELQSLTFKFSGQSSSDLLTSLEQF
ncbi:MAG: hemolysin activation/secretion protein, partial [Gammaproteobacteria bacterium]